MECKIMGDMPLELATHLGQEVEEGNTEYKYKLVDPTDERVQHLITQLNWRLNEGSNEARYEIGVHDNGTPLGISDEDMASSLATLARMCDAVDAEMTVNSFAQGLHGKVAEVIVHRKETQQFCPLETRIAVAGDVDAGKSTLIGVLSKGTLDNGRGLARMHVFRYNHEIENGRTSSISTHHIHFDHKGDVLNLSNCMQALTPPELMHDTERILSFIDLAGHRKYLKTTVSGITGRNPEYCMLVVAANSGVQPMTGEHLGIPLALNLPLFVVITKIDVTCEQKLNATLRTLQTVIHHAQRRMRIINTEDEIVDILARENLLECVPVFLASSVTGEHLDMLKKFLYLLPPRSEWAMARQRSAEVQIEDCFEVDEVGLVLCGTVQAGCVSMGDAMWCGPTEDGGFVSTTIQSVQVNRVPVRCACAGQSAAFSVSHDGDPIWDTLRKRKGVVLLGDNVTPVACFEFEADIVVLHHPTQICLNYEPVVHVRCVRQTARLIHMDAEHLKTGDRARCRFRFLSQPEYLVPGMPVIFRDGRTRAVGRIAHIYPVVQQQLPVNSVVA